MPLPFALAIGYLVVNVAITAWIVREEAAGRVPPPGVVITSRVARYGPAILGLGYLVTRAGDWPFFLFVLGFFTFSTWLLDRFANYPDDPKTRR